MATSANFEAPWAWNPGGTGTVQTLQTGDKLTGSGDNATLNATLIAGAVTPTLTNIATLNLRAEALSALTLSNATGVENINSVGSLAALTVNGVKAKLDSVGLSNTNSDLTITHADAALSGTDDAVTLNLNAAGSAAGQPVVTLQTLTAASGYETVNIVTAGGASRLNQLTDGVSTSLATINVAGDQALRIDNALDATVKTLDASAMTEGGSVRATLQAFATGHKVTGSVGNDRITIQDLNANDVVDLGAGTSDTLIAVDTSTAGTINGLNTNIKGVEQLGVQANGANISFDSTKVEGIKGVSLTTDAGGARNFTATVNNDVLTSKEGSGVTLTNGVGTVALTVKGADTSGTDHLTVKIGDTATSTTAFNTGAITANSIETLTLNVGDAATHTVGGLTAGALTQLNITGGSANNTFTLTGAANVANIDGSAFKGGLVLFGAAAAPAGTVATQYVEMGAGNDSFTFSTGTPGTAVAAANPINIVTGGAGADTFEFADASNTFSKAGFLAANVTSASQFDRIVDLDFGGISTNASTNSDYFIFNDGAGGGAVARGSSTIVNDGQVVALSTTTYTTLHAALDAVVSGASVSKAGGGTATGVDNGGAATTNIAGLFSYDGAVFLVGEVGSGAASTTYDDATNYIVAVGTVTGTLDAWDIAVL